jgi:hypothetical protein
MAACALALITCKDSSGPPPPGWLDVRLVTPNLNDGGILFAIGGARIDSVRTSYPYFVAHAETETQWRVVVGGTISGGVIARVWVPDVRAAARYETTVLEVAVRGTLAQRATAGYSVQVVDAQ